MSLRIYRVDKLIDMGATLSGECGNVDDGCIGHIGIVLRLDNLTSGIRA